MWCKDKRKRDGRGVTIRLSIFTNVINSERTAVREDSSAFCFPSYRHGKQKNPTASRVPTVGNVKALVALGGL